MPREFEILVVDDNMGDLHLIQEAFSECGESFRLTCIDNVAAALKVLDDRTFDLVLSDMGTGGEGLAIVRAIRADPRFRATPVIVLSGMLNSLPALRGGSECIRFQRC